MPPAIIAGLRMLEALLDARVPAPGAELGEDHAAGIRSSGGAAASRDGDVFHRLRVTRGVSHRGAEGDGVGGSALAAHQRAASDGGDVEDPRAPGSRGGGEGPAPNFVGVASSVLRLNATARFGPEVAQDALSSPDLRVETHHLLSFILALCASEWDSAVANGAEARKRRKSGSLRRTRRARAGAITPAPPPRSSKTCWTRRCCSSGRSRCCARRTRTCCAGAGRPRSCSDADLPFEYYSSPEKIAVLFPTLVSVAFFGHATNRRLIAHELSSLEMVRDFVREEAGEEGR